jgi:mono/diheme cytochrome c family protein
MKKTFRCIDRAVLFTITMVALVACGGQAMPPPVAPTSTSLPPAPTEAPTNTPLPTPTDMPQSTPTEASTVTLPSPTDTPQAAPAEAAEKPPAELVEAANQAYAQNSCAACHGVNYEGGLGPILVGLPAERIQLLTRGGVPEVGMPAFDQDAISDDELSTLAEVPKRPHVRGHRSRIASCRG